jgi:hypothetical protein
LDLGRFIKFLKVLKRANRSLNKFLSAELNADFKSVETIAKNHTQKV